MSDAPTLDLRPGFYYVTVRRPRAGIDPQAPVSWEYRPLRGPWPTHSQAIDALPAARAQAINVDVKAQWYEFGCARCLEHQGPGLLDIMDARRAAGSSADTDVDGTGK